MTPIRKCASHGSAEKLKMSFKVGEQSAVTAGGLHSAAPISATSLCGDLLQTFTSVSIRKAEGMAGESGDGLWV